MWTGIVALLASVAPDRVEAEDMEQDLSREIVELHQFFEDWFNAAIPESDDSFSRLERALGPEFELIGPEGRVHRRGSLMAGLRSAHGKWADTPGHIWIESVRLLHREGNLALVSYEEWQEVDGETAVRLSSVLFAVAPDAPNGLSWLHLHEVWMSR